MFPNPAPEVGNDALPNVKLQNEPTNCVKLTVNGAKTTPNGAGQMGNPGSRTGVRAAFSRADTCTFGEKSY